MTEKKEQKIVVCLSLTPYDQNLILTGVRIAAIFGKELCLLYRYPLKNRKDHNEYKTKLQDYLRPLSHEVPGLRISSLLVNYPLRELPEILSDEQEAIFFIVASSEYSRYSIALSRSPVPFLFVNNRDTIVLEFNKVVMPVDLRTENSDSALWASYFGRFNHAEVVVVAAGDKASENRQQVNRNVFLTKKLFEKFLIRHKIYKGNRSSFGNASESLELALNSHANLLIVLGSSVITPIDRIIGLPERKIVSKAENIPVLIVNPRRDNYILCD